MTHKECFDALSGIMTRANNEAAETINRLANDIYHVGCLAGAEENVRKTAFAKIINALYLDHKDSAAYNAKVTIMLNSEILYDGPASGITNDLLEKNWTLVSIEPSSEFEYAHLPNYNRPKIITVA